MSYLSIPIKIMLLFYIYKEHLTKTIPSRSGNLYVSDCIKLAETIPNSKIICITYLENLICFGPVTSKKLQNILLYFDFHKFVFKTNH